MNPSPGRSVLFHGTVTAPCMSLPESPVARGSVSTAVCLVRRVRQGELGCVFG